MNWLSLILFAVAAVVFLLDTVQYNANKVRLLSLGLVFLTTGFVAQFIWQNYHIVIH